uniref:Retrotransposon gag domain-containing protein n=1 Tax=Fagus sylvatica TaxID=28930 RepID=A0A2N9HZX0_FAGSY
MFPPNAPHVEIRQGLMAILTNFKGLENENPYVHVRAFEEDKAKGWLYTLKPRSIESWGEMTQEFYKKFFPPHKVQQVKRKISGFVQGNDETLFMTWERFKDTYNFYPTHGYDTWRNSLKMLWTTWMRELRIPTLGMDQIPWIPQTGVEVVLPHLVRGSYGGMPDLLGDRPCHKCMNFNTSHTTSSSSRPPLEDVLYTFIQTQGEQNQRFETMFTRIDEEMRETKSHVARLTDALSRTERGKLTSQTQPNPNNQSVKVVNTEKFEEVKSVTILRSGKKIGKDAPKANEKSKEILVEKDENGIAKSNDIEKCPLLTPFPQTLKLPKNLDVTSEILEHLHQVKVNLPLLHLIKQMPLYAKVIKDLCTIKRKYHVKKTAFLTEQVSAIIQHKVPPKYKDPGCPTISCTIEDYNIEHALLDLGASVNLLPFSVYLQPGRPFLATANTLINCRNGRMKITFDSMTIELNILNVNPQQLMDEEYAPKLGLTKTSKVLPLASIEPHATSTVEVPSKISVDQEIEKEGEKTKFFERHKTKRKELQDTRLSKKLLNSSKGVALHVARMKSARGRNYSFGGSRSGG